MKLLKILLFTFFLLNLCLFAVPRESLAAVGVQQDLKFNPNISIPGTEFQHSDNRSGGVPVTGSLLGDYIQALYKFFVGVAGILAVIMIAIGGLLWLFSSGDSGKITKAKEIIIGAIVGLILVLSSYLILNTVNPALVIFKSLNIRTDGSVPGCCLMTDKQGTWGISDDTAKDYHLAERTDDEAACLYKLKTSFDVKTAYDAFLKKYAAGYPAELPIDTILQSFAGHVFTVDEVTFFQDPDPGVSTYEVAPIEDFNLLAATGVVPGANWGTQCSIDSRYTFGNNNGANQPASNGLTVQGWTFQGSIEDQMVDASPQLLEMMDCMRGVLNDYQRTMDLTIGNIASIGNDGYTGHLEDCRADPKPANCDHSATSCHYGDGYEGNKSHAVDLGDDEPAKKQAICEAAVYCKQFAGYIVNEGDHVHISTRRCRGDADNIPLQGDFNCEEF